MDTGNVIVNVVDVGQGQCTFVEIHDSAGALTQTLLFDCGTDKPSDETPANIQYIVDKVAPKGGKAFDCVFFSHSDDDHISLMKGLLEAIAKIRKPTIGEVWFGGARFKYEKGPKDDPFSILDYIETEGYCATADIKAMSSNYSGYDPAGGNYSHYLWLSPDKSVAAYPIACNVLSSNPDWEDNDRVITAKTPEARNRVSLVCGLYYAGVSYVICGDATNATMAAINGLFEGGTTVFDANIMTTLPHHGSRTTGLKPKSLATAYQKSVQVVSAFCAFLKSRSMTVSAYQMHNHPSLLLMCNFPPTAKQPDVRDPRLTETNAHRVVALNDLELRIKNGKTLSSENYYTIDSRTNTFTTNYSDGDSRFRTEIGVALTAADRVERSQGVVSASTPINPFACWIYTTGSSGQVALEGRKNLSSAAFTVAVPPTAAASIPAGADAMAAPGTAAPSPEKPPKAAAAARVPVSQPRSHAHGLRALR